MILLADSGSTKTDWCLVENGQAIKTIKTGGTNPFFQTEDEISSEILTSLVPQLPSTTIEDVFFYGAGCTPEKQPILANALKRHLNVTGKCEVASDMLAAARSLCGHRPGIACIMGTGSNSCAYDGEKVTKNVSPLGFILGDEGSGAVLGRTLVGDILKNQMPQDIIDKFNVKYHLTNADIIERVYRQKLPNRFLASFVPFLAENIQDHAVYNLVLESFQRFLVRNVKQYDNWNSLPIGFNGSIAYYFQKPLEDALEQQGMHLGRIIQAPMEGLVAYHTDKI
ncbi:MAG: ATPase [Prevotella sp.]